MRARSVRLVWLRNLFCLLVTSATLYVAFVQPFAQLTFDFALSICAGTFALLVIAGPRRTPKTLQLLIVNACVLVILGEVGLRALAIISPSPLLVTGNVPIDERIETHRYPSGQIRWGFACNSGGHYDVEFAPRSQRSRTTVAMIGDSFSTGVVPHHYHFTTVCERTLGNAEIYNVGVSSIDPPHYRELLRTEVLPLEPDAIVVNVFVGNDLGALSRSGASWLRSWLDQENVLLWVLPQRLAAIEAERSESGGDTADVGRPQGEGLAQLLVSDPEELTAKFPWVSDYSFEKPTFSSERFLNIELFRATRVCSPRRRNYDECVVVLEEMKQMAGKTPFGVVLIPDEFQVEDELWSRITSKSEETLDRDQPQRILSESLRARGIEFVDLLPALRAARPQADGKRHVYQLRDTHFNARGNRIAGEVMAPFVGSLVQITGR